MTASLRDALLAFDGKAVSCLSEASAKFKAAPDYLSQLVALAGVREAEIAAGATWMLKDHLEHGGSLPRDLVAPVLQTLTSMPSWSAILHILQSVRYLDLRDVNDPAIFEAIVGFTRHERPFLRAWAVDALCHWSTVHPNVQRQAEYALKRAGNDPAASVRARARKIAKDMSK